jgi:hypothetical protein
VPEPSPLERATRFRSSAAACGIFAANAVSVSDRELLLRMQGSWLARASHEDWVGRLPPEPPAGSSALAVPLARVGSAIAFEVLRLRRS